MPRFTTALGASAGQGHLPNLGVGRRGRSLSISRVGNAEMPLCRAYGDVFAAALAPQLDAVTALFSEFLMACRPL